MAQIQASLLNPSTHFDFGGLDYKRGSWELYYDNKEFDSQKLLIKDRIRVGIRNTYDRNEILQKPISIDSWLDGTGTPFSSLGDLIIYLGSFINFIPDANIGLTQKVDTFDDLVSGELEGDLAYVETAQGTQWLPNSLGGTYYPEGWYVWNGTDWVSDRNAIANQLETNILSNSQALSEIVLLDDRITILENEDHILFNTLPSLP